MTVAIVCNETVSFTTEGAPLCSSGWQTISYESVIPFDVSQLDAGELSSAFAAGFGVLLLVWAACKSVEIILKMVK